MYIKICNLEFKASNLQQLQYRVFDKQRKLKSILKLNCLNEEKKAK